MRPESLIDTVVSEGLATVFERDAAGSPTPWGNYPEEVHAWATELLALSNDAPRDEWMARHPEGRRWVGYKVGTYLVDRAVLVSTSTETLIRMALPDRDPGDAQPGRQPMGLASGTRRDLL